MSFNVTVKANLKYTFAVIYQRIIRPGLIFSIHQHARFYCRTIVCRCFRFVFKEDGHCEIILLVDGFVSYLKRADTMKLFYKPILLIINTKLLQNKCC